MAYRRFETEKAKYLLQLMNHSEYQNHSSAIKNNGISQISGVDPFIFDEVDALVIEEFSGELLRCLKELQFRAKHDQKGGDPRFLPVGRALKRQSPVYCVDVPFSVSKRGKEASLIKKSNEKALEYFYTHGIKWDELSEEISREVTALYDNILYDDPEVEVRNAVGAEKLERFVAADMRLHLGRKPLIGILYGFGHAGLEWDLKEPERSQKTIERVRRWPTFYEEIFSLVDKAIFLPEKRIVRVRTFDTRCFK